MPPPSTAHLITPPQWEGLPTRHHMKWNDARQWQHQQMMHSDRQQQTTMTDKQWLKTNGDQWPTTTQTPNVEHPAAPPTNDEERPAPTLHKHHHHPPAPTTNSEEGTPLPPMNGNERHHHPPTPTTNGHEQPPMNRTTTINQWWRGAHTTITTTNQWWQAPPPSNSTHHERHHHHQPMARRANHHHQQTVMRACLFLPSCLPFNVHSNNIVYLLLFKYIWILHVHSYMMLQKSVD